jgi:predicted O-methyltransferase YrrM
MKKIIPYLLRYSLKDCDRPHEELPRSDLYHSPYLDLEAETNKHKNIFDAGAANYEESLLLYAMVIATKPNLVLETGGLEGFTTMHIGLALKDQGFGHLYSIEYNLEYVEKINKLIELRELSEWVTVVHQSSFDFIRETDKIFDFVFLDTEIEQRMEEYNAIKEKLSKDAPVMIHDSSINHPFGPMDFSSISETTDIINIPTPRGMAILQPKKERSIKKNNEKNINKNIQ